MRMMTRNVRVRCYQIRCRSLLGFMTISMGFKNSLRTGGIVKISILTKIMMIRNVRVRCCICWGLTSGGDVGWTSSLPPQPPKSGRGARQAVMSRRDYSSLTIGRILWLGMKSPHGWDEEFKNLDPKNKKMVKKNDQKSSQMNCMCTCDGLRPLW